MRQIPGMPQGKVHSRIMSTRVQCSKHEMPIFIGPCVTPRASHFAHPWTTLNNSDGYRLPSTQGGRVSKALRCRQTRNRRFSFAPRDTRGSATFPHSSVASRRWTSHGYHTQSPLVPILTARPPPPQPKCTALDARVGTGIHPCHSTPRLVRETHACLDPLRRTPACGKAPICPPRKRMTRDSQAFGWDSCLIKAQRALPVRHTVKAHQSPPPPPTRTSHALEASKRRAG